MIDIVIPHNNEEEFISIACKLGFKGICFLYNFDNEKKFESDKIKVYTGIIADKGKINRHDKKTFVAAKSSDKDREVIEKSKADLIFDLEENPRRDAMHQRISGLNHILCRLAHENNVSVGLSLSSVLNSEKKPVIIGRMMQNIRLCRKFKAKIVIASDPYEMRSLHDMISFFKSLGLENPSFIKF